MPKLFKYLVVQGSHSATFMAMNPYDAARLYCDNDGAVDDTVLHVYDESGKRAEYHVEVNVKLTRKY